MDLLSQLASCLHFGEFAKRNEAHAWQRKELDEPGQVDAREAAERGGRDKGQVAAIDTFSAEAVQLSLSNLGGTFIMVQQPGERVPGLPAMAG